MSSKLTDPRIEDLFRFHATHGGNLFAVTSDINLLGLYIAKNSRAKAENLVDLYNLIFGNIVEEFQTTLNEGREKIVFLPSGEETTILGVCSDTSRTDAWLSGLAADTQNRVRESGLIDPENTRIIFGWAYLEAPELLQRIGAAGSTNDPKEFYSIMEQIRDILARRIDANKFRHFVESNDELAVLYRNLSLAEYAEHKVNTEELLRALNEYCRNHNIDFPPSLVKEYGVYNGKMAMVKEIKKKISK